MSKTYCDNCNITHTALMCFNKPKRPIRNRMPNYNWRQTVIRWHMKNPPVNGGWICYLNISDICPLKLDRSTLVLEHVIPKSRGKKYKYDINNIRPACYFCNSIKGSKTLDVLALEYPKLLNLLQLDS